MPLELIRNDIAVMETDAIVNAASTTLQIGGGVCGAIFAAAGAAEMQAACAALAPIRTGEAALSPGFALPARFVIHAAGPVWRGGAHGEEQHLRACYRNALALAAEQGCESIAFPLLSSGIYGYPKAEALAVAMSEIRAFLQSNDMQVYLCVYDREAFALSRALLGEVKTYIDAHYVDVRARKSRRRELFDAHEELLHSEMPRLAEAQAMPAPQQAFREQKAAAFTLDESFARTLFRLIDAAGRTDVEVYKRANIDRRLFSKIRSSEGYMPSKRTALALAVALELPLEGTNDLLRRAGYALSHSVMFDVIVEYFIINGRYDVFEINEVLFQYEQALLGG